MNKRIVFLFILLASLPAFLSAQTGKPATLVLGAGAFLDELPAGHYITDAQEQKVPWLFNNTGLVMTTRSNYVIKVNIPQPGTWYLYARCLGKRGNTFRVSINDSVINADLAGGPLSFKKTGTFKLAKGVADLRLMRIEGAPVLDALVLSTNPDFQEGDLAAFQYGDDATLIKEYKIPGETSAVRFGDVNNDGKTDFLVVNDNYAAYLFDNSGQELWKYEIGPDGVKDEAPGLIWDIDQDGWADVIHWRLIDGKEWLVVADGRTGAVKKKVEWPGVKSLPHAFNNYRIAVAKFNPGYPDHLVVYTDIGGLATIAAYDKDLKQIWVRTDNKKKDHLGHYIYLKDLNGDGIDEVLAGSLLLDANGKELWNRFKIYYDNHDHADAYSFADLNKDGKPEILVAHSEVGVMALDAATGRTLWQNTAEHTQRIETGNFLKGVAGPQIAVTARTYGNQSAGEPYLWGQVQWFGPKGERISRWPANPITGNPAFVKGDWKGDGKEELFWSKFRMNDQGKGIQYFGEPVYHMFSFMGYKSEEVITMQDGILKVYGYKGASHQPVKKGLTYLRDVVVNHSYY